MKVPVLMLTLLVGIVAAQSAKPASPITGEWEGTSLCTIPDSPCHNEHVVYDIEAKKGEAMKYMIHGYKIVQGEKQFMGDLQCTHHPAESTLSCFFKSPENDDWEFTIQKEEMTGTLMVENKKKLFRRIHVTRRSAQ